MTTLHVVCNRYGVPITIERTMLTAEAGGIHKTQFNDRIGTAPTQPKRGAYVTVVGRFSCGRAAHSSSVQTWSRQSMGPQITSMGMAGSARRGWRGSGRGATGADLP